MSRLNIIYMTLCLLVSCVAHCADSKKSTISQEAKLITKLIKSRESLVFLGTEDPKLYSWRLEDWSDELLAQPSPESSTLYDVRGAWDIWGQNWDILIEQYTLPLAVKKEEKLFKKPQIVSVCACFEADHSKTTENEKNYTVLAGKDYRIFDGDKQQRIIANASSADGDRFKRLFCAGRKTVWNPPTTECLKLDVESCEKKIKRFVWDSQIGVTRDEILKAVHHNAICQRKTL